MDGHENDVDTLGQPSATPESTTPVAPTEGGIFSGNDTRIETENLPEVVPEVIQQAPMSAISPALRTESTVTSDLHLGGTTKKKKWPFIAIAAGVAVVVIGILAAKVIPTITSNPSSTDHTKYIESYNKFANYLLSGHAETNASVSNGTATRALQERDSAFFNEASRLYSDFLNEYNSDASSLNAVLPIYTNLSIVSAYSRVEFLDINTTMAYYAKNGVTATNAKITESLNELQSSTSTSAYSDEIYNDAKEYLDVELELLDLTARSGCFEGREIDQTCIATIQVPADLQERITSANSALSNMSQIVSDALDNLISAVMTVKESL